MAVGTLVGARVLVGAGVGGAAQALSASRQIKSNALLAISVFTTTDLV
jgi:hypothetical protein